MLHEIWSYSRPLWAEGSLELLFILFTKQNIYKKLCLIAAASGNAEFDCPTPHGKASLLGNATCMKQANIDEWLGESLGTKGYLRVLTTYFSSAQDVGHRQCISSNSDLEGRHVEDCQDRQVKIPLVDDKAKRSPQEMRHLFSGRWQWLHLSLDHKPERAQSTLPGSKRKASESMNNLERQYSSCASGCLQLARECELECRSRHLFLSLYIIDLRWAASFSCTYFGINLQSVTSCSLPWLLSEYYNPSEEISSEQ